MAYSCPRKESERERKKILLGLVGTVVACEWLWRMVVDKKEGAKVAELSMGSDWTRKERKMREDGLAVGGCAVAG